MSIEIQDIDDDTVSLPRVDSAHSLIQCKHNCATVQFVPKCGHSFRSLELLPSDLDLVETGPTVPNLFPSI